MGYRTYFTLYINPQDGNSPEIEERDRKIIEELRATSTSAEYALEDNGYPANEESWYDHEEEMKEFSKSYPEYLFVLYGEGEGSEDYWVLYFKNGKMHGGNAELVYPEFDENLLN